MSPKAIIYCVECGISMSLTDAEFAVETPEGPVHRECVETGTIRLIEPKATVVYDNGKQAEFYRKSLGLEEERHG